jgi:polyisoprenoid-binding protein YceI
MRHPKILLLFLLAILFAGVIAPGKKKIVADKKESAISYSMVHPLHEWTGTSKDVNCVIIYNQDSGRIESVAVSVLVSTFDSKNSNRDSHAMEVLDAIKYPTVKFTSNDIRQNGEDLTIRGNLIFHNISKPMTLLAKRKDGNKETSIEGSFIVHITDHEVPPPSMMGMKTDEKMTLNFKIVFPF